MLMIRLQRIGRKKAPSYRVVISEKTKDPQAGTIEILGTYDPTKTPKIIEFKQERIEYWMSKGAQPSETVHNLLVSAGILKGDKQKSVKVSNKRRAKIDEKNAAEAEKAKEAVEAAKAKEEEEKAAAAAAEEAPAEAPAEEAASAEEKSEEPAVEAAPAESEAPAEEPKEEAPAEESAPEAPAETEAPAEEAAEEKEA